MLTIGVGRSTFKKTAVFGAFVCFSPATLSGGEFFIADGAKVGAVACDPHFAALPDTYNFVHVWQSRSHIRQAMGLAQPPIVTISDV